MSLKQATNALILALAALFVTKLLLVQDAPQIFVNILFEIILTRVVNADLHIIKLNYSPCQYLMI